MPGVRRAPAVFLDRDNTVIHNDGDLGDPDAVVLIQGAAMAIASLCGLGYKVVVVTNQGGVARGKYTEADVDAVHDRIRELVEESANGARIEAFYFCPYHPEGAVPEYTREHDDRKPRPGMLLRAGDEHGLDLSRSWMVGDQLRDVEAGVAAGCRTVWLTNKPHERTDADPEPDHTTRSLVEAVRFIASQRHTRDEQASPPRNTGRRFDAETMAQLQQPKPPRDAEEHGEPAGGDATPRAAARPFRPYDLPPPEEDSDNTASSDAAAARTPRLRLARMVERVRPMSAGQRPQAEAASTPDESHGEPAPEPQTQVVSLALSPEAEQEEADVRQCPVTPSESPEQAAESLDRPEPASTSAESPRLLRMILQELRGQRGTHGTDTGPVTLIAIVLEAVAVVALLAGLWLGAADVDGVRDDGVFFRCLGVAVVVQLGVIALLLSRGRH